MIKRKHLNFIVDAFAFAILALLISTGLLLRYNLPPGSGGLHGSGSGYQAGEKMVTILWGLTRHEWGNIHFWISIALTAVLALHLLLHWRWIICIIRGKSREGSGIRFGLGFLGMLTLLAMAIIPLISPTVQLSRSQLQQPMEQKSTTDFPSKIQPLKTPIEIPEIRGSMSLAEISELTKVPTSFLINHLKLPEDTPINQRLGKLRKRYGFSMNKVRTIIKKYSQTP